jgi:hypothetical protein
MPKFYWIFLMLAVGMGWVLSKKKKRNPIQYQGTILTYVHEMEQDTPFLKMLKHLSIGVQNRGGYCIRMSAEQEGHHEELRFYNVNLENRKLYATFGQLNDANHGILQAKTGALLFTPPFYDYWERVFKRFHEKQLLGAAHTDWGYKFTTTFSDSTYQELVATDYFDQSYSHFYNLERQCDSNVRYAYQIFLFTDSVRGKEIIKTLSRMRTIRKLSETIYVQRTTAYNEFDLFSDRPRHYCHEWF